MITTSYRFPSLQHSKSHKSFSQYTGNCYSISHALNGLLHNLKKHYHVQWSFPHLPIRGQTNPVHISHRKANFAFTGPFRELNCCTIYLTSLSTHILYRRIRRHAKIQFTSFSKFSGVIGTLDPWVNSIITEYNGYIWMRIFVVNSDDQKWERIHSHCITCRHIPLLGIHINQDEIEISIHHTGFIQVGRPR